MCVVSLYIFSNIWNFIFTDLFLVDGRLLEIFYLIFVNLLFDFYYNIQYVFIMLGRNEGGVVSHLESCII